MRLCGLNDRPQASESRKKVPTHPRQQQHNPLASVVEQPLHLNGALASLRSSESSLEQVHQRCGLCLSEPKCLEGARDVVSGHTHADGEEAEEWLVCSTQEKASGWPSSHTQ